MVSKKTKIINTQGFHMRPAGVFVKEITPFKSEVRINTESNSADAKSLMSLLAACLKYGTEIEVTADGPDEDEALAKAVEMIDSGLGEL